MRLSVAMVLLAACGRLSFDARSDGNTSDGADVPNRMFLSQLTTDGSFGGVAFADQTCADEAVAASLTGTFIAFLSDSTTSARARIEASRGWVRIDGTPIGDTAASMFDDAALFNTANQLADGTILTAASTWTGSDGKAVASANCANWMSASVTQMGDGNAVLNATFAGGNLQTCDVKRHLTCVEIGHTALVAPRPGVGRHVFVSSAGRTGAVGVAAANTLCAADATAAGLPGFYKAALATSTATIASQFPEDSRAWVRIDGTQIAAAGEMFAGANPYDSFPNQEASGQYINIGVWTGVATTPTAVSTLADTCQNWSTMAAGSSGGRGVIATTNRATLWSNTGSACANVYRILCVEN